MILTALEKEYIVLLIKSKAWMLSGDEAEYHRVMCANIIKKLEEKIVGKD